MRGGNVSRAVIRRQLATCSLGRFRRPDFVASPGWLGLLLVCSLLAGCAGVKAASTASMMRAIASPGAASPAQSQPSANPAPTTAAVRVPGASASEPPSGTTPPAPANTPGSGLDVGTLAGNLVSGLAWAILALVGAFMLQARQNRLEGVVDSGVRSCRVY
jgi:hypothetical protein